jgi:arginase
MPLAIALGMGLDELTGIHGFAPKIDPDRVAVVGLRNVDEEESEAIRQSGIHYFTMRDIDERGVSAVIGDALDVANRHGMPYHVSLDLDMVDPQIAPGVGTPVRGGTTFRESHLIMELICDNGGMCSLDLGEINPVLDDYNRTAALGVDLVLSGFGKTIL